MNFWTNDIKPKYEKRRNSSLDGFNELNDFLLDLENIEAYGFHIGTSVNLHLYYNDIFLFYFKFNNVYFNTSRFKPISFSSKYNQQVKEGIYPDEAEETPAIFFEPLVDRLHQIKNLSGKVFAMKWLGVNKGNTKKIPFWEIKVNKSEFAETFFDICREILADIAKVNKEIMFPERFQ